MSLKIVMKISVSLFIINPPILISCILNWKNSKILTNLDKSDIFTFLPKSHLYGLSVNWDIRQVGQIFSGPWESHLTGVYCKTDDRFSFYTIFLSEIRSIFKMCKIERFLTKTRDQETHRKSWSLLLNPIFTLLFRSAVSLRWSWRSKIILYFSCNSQAIYNFWDFKKSLTEK